MGIEVRVGVVKVTDNSRGEEGKEIESTEIEQLPLLYLICVLC